MTRYLFIHRGLRALIIMSMTTASIAYAEDDNGHIRTLASSCMVCHSNISVNKSIPSLAGLDESYFIRQIKIYQNSNDQNAVMVQHAKGLTETEIIQLAEFFAQQPRACPYYQKHPAEKLLE